jgi:hypothetical protein
MPTNELPRMFAVRQLFPASPPLDVSVAVAREFARAKLPLQPGARIAVAVGSRGISNLFQVVEAVIEQLKLAGAQPYVVPAMGSHGGATPEGQTQLLAEYGITEERLRIGIRASMAVERLGETPDGVEVFFSAEAMKSDGVVLINRIKPHTDFVSDKLGSGILKMMVIGLGKRSGAATFHAAASQHGYEKVIRSCARVTMGAAPILCGVGLVENQRHETVSLEVMKPEDVEKREQKLFAEAQRLMPSLPFADIDLLIVDRIGKNISGGGMDPNVIGRGVHGYSSSLGQKNKTGPTVRRLFVRELTPESHGNAVGLGLADFTTARVVRGIDLEVTAINALTALTVQSAKIPIHFETDRIVLGHALGSLALRDFRQAKVMRIADTLSLETVELSEAYEAEAKRRKDLEMRSNTLEMMFDESDNLLPL